MSTRTDGGKDWTVQLGREKEKGAQSFADSVWLQM